MGSKQVAIEPMRMEVEMKDTNVAKSAAAATGWINT